MAKAKAGETAAKGLSAPAEEEPELVSRPVQAGIGLLTGVAVFGTALGGLFAIAFALAYRRMGDFTPRATSAPLFPKVHSCERRDPNPVLTIKVLIH